MSVDGEKKFIVHNGDKFTIEVTDYSCKIIPKKETKLGLLKQEARKVKNMTPSDYTTDSWNVLYGYIDDADALIALGEDNADAEAISELYDEIVLAKSSLILAKPVVTEATEGSSIVKGTAAYGANVTVEINGQTYDAIADEITGEWEIDASELIRLTDVIYVSVYRDLIQSEQLVYDMSDIKNQRLKAKLMVNGSISDVNLTVGNDIKLDVEATGGGGSYAYKFVMTNMKTGTTITLRDYGSASSYTGPLTSVGTKKFTVYIKDSKGTVVETNTVTVVTGTGLELTAGLKVNGSTSAVNLTVGSKVTLVPVATGESGSYTYKYVMENVTAGKTMTLKDYSSAANYVGPLTSVGTKKFTVYVKDSTGKVVETNTVTVVVK